MKKLILLPFLLGGGLFAQTPSIIWQNTIGGDAGDYFKNITKVPSGGYICAGESYSNISGDKTDNVNGADDYWIIKIDELGTIEWQKNIGSDGNDRVTKVRPTSDGGYICLGISTGSIASGDKTEPTRGSSDYWVVKLDQNGNIEWDKTIGGNSQDTPYEIIEAEDGGFVIAGHSNSRSSTIIPTSDKTEDRINNSFDLWIVKLTSNGQLDWQNTIGGNGADFMGGMSKTSDGYIIAATSASPISADKTEASKGSFDYWIVKLDQAGVVVWDKTIGGTGYEAPQSIQQTSDGGYIVGGESNSPIGADKTEDNIGGEDMWVLKLDATANVEWDKTLGGTGEEKLKTVLQKSTGSYVIGGHSNSPISGTKTQDSIGGYDYYLTALNGDGTIRWDDAIGGTEREEFGSLEEATDGNLVIGGWSQSGMDGDKSEVSQDATTNLADFWILKLAPPALSSIEQTNTTNFSFYPNPANEEINIIHKKTFTGSISIYNTKGQLIKSENTSNRFKSILNISDINKGMYFLELREINKEPVTKKLVIE